MTAAEIKARLKAKKITQVALCRRLSCSPTAIHFLVNKQLTSKRLERRLARILGVSLSDLRDGNGAA